MHKTGIGWRISELNIKIFDVQNVCHFLPWMVEPIICLKQYRFYNIAKIKLNTNIFNVKSIYIEKPNQHFYRKYRQEGMFFQSPFHACTTRGMIMENTSAKL